MVNGIRSRLILAGRWPVITAEGMKAWAISMEKAKVMSKGKKVQSSTNHLWTLSQSALVINSGSITGIVWLPSPGLFSDRSSWPGPSENYHNYLKGVKSIYGQNLANQSQLRFAEPVAQAL
jgi:hypothetical protein